VSLKHFRPSDVARDVPVFLFDPFFCWRFFVFALTTVFRKAVFEVFFSIIHSVLISAESRFAILQIVNSNNLVAALADQAVIYLYPSIDWQAVSSRNWLVPSQ
jgi:hypothetical protein